MPKVSGEIKNQKQSASTVETPIEFQSEPDTQTAAEKIIGKFVLGRAEARSIIAQTKAIEAQENLDRYRREKFFIKHRIKDAKTGAESEVSLTRCRAAKTLLFARLDFGKSVGVERAEKFA